MIIEELKNWVIELGDNAKDSKYIQVFIKTKDTKIQYIQILYACS